MSPSPRPSAPRRPGRLAALAIALATGLSTIVSAPAHAAVPVAFTDPTTPHRFVVPPDITTITVTLVAAGGGAGGSSPGFLFEPGAGGGGAGGGATVACVLTVTGGQALVLQVGAGGRGGPHYTSENGRADDGTPGQSTTIERDGVLLASATGGQGGGGTVGHFGHGGAGGQGGRSGHCTGTNPSVSVGTDGGKGQDGYLFNNHGGVAGAAGEPVPAQCPNGTGDGAAGPSGGLFDGYNGDSGNNGCIVITV